MAGARGCFNCGGCAWCFRVVVAVVVSPSRASCTDAACTYPSPTPSLLSFSLTPLFFFSCRAWCGADGDRVFFIHCIHIGPAQSKIHCPKKKCMVVCIVTPSVLIVSWAPGRKLSQGRHAYLVNAFFSPIRTRSRELLL
ncbi:hypothetical protein EDB89DRAFT_1978115 [Lactarius sanguifluus]|nr:hypothetical protein EDB89DRAFT_1978115 [Lactarius sanguifluus]